ncbi:MAG: glycine cleavage T C-terminal barrel domain-containing protein, partial [Pseudomonadota bacterium]
PSVSDVLVDIEPYTITPAWELPSVEAPSKTRAFVDVQNDVTSKDLKLAVQEGYRSVEHAKRYTTVGMGTDQGKVSGLNAFGILGKAMGKTIPEVGVTTFRQPYKPVTMGAVAGQHAGNTFHPRRTTPMHDWHVEADATFETVGDWLRARTYPRKGESFHDAVQRETKAARTGLGMLDASTLGKIDIKGPDAREFLNRVYTNAWKKLPVGSCRYGLMLNEDGMVFDDGVTACLADDHFHMTTTTGGAANVLGWLEEYHQTEWQDLQVYMTTVTEQWAVASVCGRHARALVSELVEGIDFADDAFPFMTHRTGTMAGIPVRVFRISFTGELSYEINIPARYGLWMWRTLLAAGEAHGGMTPYGTEAMHVLRAEKGFIIVGQDTDGTVTPHDLQMSWIVKKSADFIGARSLSRSDTAREDRPQLVGLITPDNPAFVVEEGAQLVFERHHANPLADAPVPMAGYVTSSYFSPNLNRSIAMALVKGGKDKMNETVWVTRRGQEAVRAQITATDFLGTLEPVSAADQAGETSQDTTLAVTEEAA